jgi:hypothetical protein
MTVVRSQCFLVITVDTECDHGPNWIKANPLAFASVIRGIPGRLQPIFAKFDARPTYLLSSEVLESKECVEVLASLAQGCELGTHLHGDYVAPQPRYTRYEGTKSKDWACRYDPELELLKLTTLTNLFIRQFGYSPLSYRAGRFGASGQTLKNLQTLGYRVDTSVTPYIIWPSHDEQPDLDFSTAPVQPYFPDERTICKKGDSNILEVPVSIDIRYPRLRRLLTPLQKSESLPGQFLHANLTAPVWLRPSLSSAESMIMLIEKYRQRHRRQKNIVLNMMFHSMEIIPGASPHAQTEEDCQRLLMRIERVLDYCQKHEFKFAALSDLYPLFASGRRNA